MIHKLKYEVKRCLNVFRLLGNFNLSESFKLAYFKKDYSSKEVLIFHPKKWLGDFKIRNSYRDLRTLQDVFLRQYHLPEKLSRLKKDCVIVDLGCNVGATIAHYKNVCPTAKIIGYEMDTDNYQLAKENTSCYSDVTIVNKAIWTKNDVLKYAKDDSYDGYSLHILSKNDNVSVNCVSIAQLISNHNLTKIDYLKMDIEGAEKDILDSKNLDWLCIVNELNIEMHLTSNKEINKYIALLESKDFDAWKDKKHSSSIRAITKS